MKKLRSSVADPDPDVWDRIRILAVINDPISTFLARVKAINTSGISID
jgi:hexokinase